MPGKPTSFRSAQMPSVAAARQEQDRRRGSARARGYDARWDKAAAAFKREHPLCLGCLAAWRRPEPTTVVDHVEPHRGDHAKFWDVSGWQPACDWHHDVVKQQLEHRFEAGKLTVADLRLDSPVAIAVSRELRPDVPLPCAG